MPILIYISWICYGIAAVGVAAMFVNESPSFLVPAVAAIVTGVLFAALARIIDRLTDIRDALMPDGAPENKRASTLMAAMVPPLQPNTLEAVEMQEDVRRLNDT